MNENAGIAIPFKAAAIPPIVIKILSFLEANLNSFKKGTVGLGGSFSVDFLVGSIISLFVSDMFVVKIFIFYYFCMIN